MEAFFGYLRAVLSKELKEVDHWRRERWPAAQEASAYRDLTGGRTGRIGTGCQSGTAAARRGEIQ